MKLLVLGSGGREHALTWKLRESPQMEEIYCAPGNAGVAQEAECLPVNFSNLEEVVELARKLPADLTVVGPEAPLVAGIVDEFEKAGLPIIGPTKAAARIEGSKIFAKRFMQSYRIPTAKFSVAEDFEEGIKALAVSQLPVVIKADGLAAGKGVVIARNQDQAEETLTALLRGKALGAAGSKVVIEEYLTGEEVSFIVLTDGRGILALAPSQDHKQLLDGDEGPNTGGMGAYSCDLILDERERDNILRRIVAPTIAGLAAEGIPYRGFLYFGLVLTGEGPKVLEYNARLGDPEAQAIMMRLRSDLLDLLLASREGRLGAVEARWSPNPSVCVVLASKGYPGTSEVGKKITGYEEAESLGGVKIFHAGTMARDGQLLTSGGRVLGVAAIGENLPAAIEQVYAAVKKIYFDGMHYRRDIGAKGVKRLGQARASQPSERQPKDRSPSR